MDDRKLAATKFPEEVGLLDDVLSKIEAESIPNVGNLLNKCNGE